MLKLTELFSLSRPVHEDASGGGYGPKVERALDALQSIEGGSLIGRTPEAHALIMALVDQADVPVAHQKRIRDILGVHQEG